MLVTLIENAFRDVPMPEGHSLTDSQHDDAREDADAFLGKRWDELDSLFLREKSFALLWFNKYAWKYYLPAFMVAAVRSDVLDALYVELLVNSLSQRLPEMRARLGILDDSQLVVLEQWVIWVAEKWGGTDCKDIEAALESLRARWWLR